MTSLRKQRHSFEISLNCSLFGTTKMPNKRFPNQNFVNIVLQLIFKNANSSFPALLNKIRETLQSFIFLFE